MKDNDVIKALEELLSEKPTRTRPYTIIGLTTAKGTSIPLKDVLDLINRQKAEIDILIRKKETLKDEIAEQQAEIERLQKANGLIKYLKEAVCRVEIGGKEEVVDYVSEEAFYSAITKKIKLMSDVQTAKAEAYKEFAERLKNHFWSKADCDVLIRGVLDNLLTELTERKEDEGK